MSFPPDHLSDGNGGTLDTTTATTRDLLVALHIKVDTMNGAIRDHEERIRANEAARLRMAGVVAFVMAAIVVIGALIAYFHR